MAVWKKNDLKEKRKEDLIKIVLNLQTLLKENDMKEDVKDLKKEMQELKDQMAELLSKMSSLPHMSSASTDDLSSATPSVPSFAAVVKETIKTTMEEDKVKSDLMISNLDDVGNDERCMNELCSKIDLNEQSRPIRLVRVGKKKDSNSKRLLKASFSTQFDARKFKASYEDAKNNETPDLLSIRVRRCRTREEETVYKTKINRLKELNEKAKEEGGTTSFSLRENGNIWKYTKDSQTGKWRRDINWSDEAEESEGSEEHSEADESGN